MLDSDNSVSIVKHELITSLTFRGSRAAKTAFALEK